MALLFSQQTPSIASFFSLPELSQQYSHKHISSPLANLHLYPARRAPSPQ